MIDAKLIEKYELFIENQNSIKFSIIDGLSKLEHEDKPILLVLDSSFNPPHWGHFTLVKKAVEYYSDRLIQDSENKGGENENKTRSQINVLLLLSVRNTDKVNNPATFDKRCEMISFLKFELENEIKPQINCSIGLTIFGKFIDKNKIIKDKYCPKGLIVYLVGFDTIVRVFDPKYYLPDPLSLALGEFMSTSEFFCLTRKTACKNAKNGSYHYDEKEKLYFQQQNYSRDIINGKYLPIIPTEWGGKIKVVTNDNKFSAISSSAIRKKFHNKNVDDYLPELLPNSIIRYIESFNETIF